MSGKLTTHVLNTASGKPAVGMRITLSCFDDETKVFYELDTFATNEDGRISQPILEGERFTKGTYELLFHVGEFFLNQSDVAGEDQFLDQVPIRFNVHDLMAHYHVPLLVTPFSYTTYRGS